MKIAIAAAGAALLLAAPSKALLDPKPAVVDGVRYDRERIYEGAYTHAFERSDFDPIGPRGEAMWLLGWTGGSGVYHIRFIGRRTASPGRYGHLGAYRHMLLITDMIDSRPEPRD